MIVYHFTNLLHQQVKIIRNLFYFLLKKCHFLFLQSITLYIDHQRDRSLYNVSNETNKIRNFIFLEFKNRNLFYLEILVI